MWPDNSHVATRKKPKHWVYFVINTAHVYSLLPHIGKLFLGSPKVRKVRSKGDGKSTSTCRVFNEATSGVKMLMKKVSSWRRPCPDWTQIFSSSFTRKCRATTTKKPQTNPQNPMSVSVTRLWPFILTILHILREVKSCLSFSLTGKCLFSVANYQTCYFAKNCVKKNKVLLFSFKIKRQKSHSLLT